MTTAAAAISDVSERLAAAGCESARVDAEILLAHVLGTTRSAVRADGRRELDAATLDELESLVAPTRASRAARLRARRVGVPAADAHGRLACARAEARDRDRRRALPRADRRDERAAGAGRRHGERCDRARDRRRAPRREGHGNGRVAARSRGRRGERLQDGTRGRPRARRRPRRPSGRTMGPRRVEPAVCRTRRDREARPRGARLGTARRARGGTFPSGSEPQGLGYRCGRAGGRGVAEA